jgi:hypothetical protein
MALVRQSTIALFFSEGQLLRMGIASNNPVSVRAIGFTTIAHQMHQKNISKRYL